MKNDFRQGFTVTELIVAMGVFVIIVTIAVGVFVNAVKSQRRLTELMAVNNNAAGALEQMAREIRTGYRFCGVQDPDAPCDIPSGETLTFENHVGDEVTYARTTEGAVTRSAGGAPAFELTAPDTIVTYLAFVVRQYGDGVNDACNPWRITVAMGVKPKNDVLGGDEVKLQTTVSSRVFPVEAPGASQSIIEICQQ
ncbi:MAG: type II secretion system protein [Candidatus Brennerbacteria bacterium]